MKLLTLNFLTCAISSCKSSPKSFPLHPQDAELESVELDFSPAFLRNVLPRIEWEAMASICTELGLTLPPSFSALAATSSGAAAREDTRMEGVETSELAASAPPLLSSSNSAASEAHDAPKTLDEITDEDLKALHEVIIETQVVSGKLVCGNCGHEYAVKEGIANFLLPPHLV